MNRNHTWLIRTMVIALFLGCISLVFDVSAEDKTKNGDSTKSSDNFAFKWRVITPWHAPDANKYWIWGQQNFFDWDDMLNPDPSSLLCRWVSDVRDWGFNAMVFFAAAPEKNYEAMRNFARYLKSQGIGMFIRRNWNETTEGFSVPLSLKTIRPSASRKWCPYSEEVRSYWKKRVAQDFEMIPDLAGYSMVATEFKF